MAFLSGGPVEIHLGNIESRLLGPVPVQRLDRLLNPHLGPGAEHGAQRAAAAAAVVYSPRSGVFLTGALPAVKRVLRAVGLAVRIRDRRGVSPHRCSWRLQGAVLRDYQEDVVATALEKGRGLVDVGLGGGKTVIAAALIARLGLPTLYLTTTRVLLLQTVRSLRALLGVEPGTIGVIGDGEERPAPLTAALVQSLRGRDLARWRDALCVFDEGHHAAAATYQDAVRRIRPRYLFGLSAVPFRSGSDQAILDALVGRPLTGGRYSARYLIDRGYACPVAVRIEPVRIQGAMAEKPFAVLYREFIVENRDRNRRVADLVRSHAFDGRRVVLLAEHVRHGELLLELLRDLAAFVHGATPRAVLVERSDAFARGSPPVLLATTSLFHEGTSIDGIEVVVNAGGLKSRARVLQTVGRGLRLAPGKRSCTYVDFLDDDPVGILRSHSRQRLATLKEEGFHVPPPEGTGSSPALGEADEDDIEPAWFHVPGSQRFLLVGGDGEVHAQALCLRKPLVPERFCRRCRNTICQRGGLVTWRAGNRA